ncbi:MAG TPA: hypothetical protein DDY13_10805 [Cytophagales bacterium]|nr:hypothetical protein [Cytophagales bacterium]
MGTTRQKIKSGFCVFDRKGNEALIIESIRNCIPFDEFQRTFNTVKELYVEKAFDKLIFDKRSLSVFDQPSME